MKRNAIAALIVGLGLAWVSTALTQDRDPVDKDRERIAELVKQLGSPKFTEREKARKDLEAIGTPALEALKKAAKDDNLETSKRAQDLVRKIEDRILTTELLNPKRVRLNIKDMPVMEAVAELSRLSGYNLQVTGDRASLAEKKLTLDTGEVSFFEALDQLCAQAGLNEQVVGNPFTPPGIRPPIVRPVRPPIRVRPLPAPVIPKIAPGVLPVPVPDKAPAKGPVDIKHEIDPFQVAQVDEPAERPVEKPAPKAEPKAVGGGVAGKVVVGPAVQVQPVPIPAIQIMPGGVGGGAPGFPGIGGPTTGPGGVIQLQPGPRKTLPTSYAGSVRIQALSGKNLPPSAVKMNGLPVVIDAMAEPRLQNFQLVGTPTILKAVDELGQELVVSSEVPKAEQPMGIPENILIIPAPGIRGPGSRQQTIVFNKGEKASKLIKELKGTVTAQAVIPNELIVKLDNVMAAAGKTVNGANGGSLSLDSIEKQADGTYRVKVRMTNLTPNPFAGGGFGGGGVIINGGAAVQIQIGPGGGVVVGGGPGGPAPRGTPDLVDAKGNKLQFAGVTSMRTSINGGQLTQEGTLLYRASPGVGDPASLVLYGERSVNFQVPFTLRDVPLE